MSEGNGLPGTVDATGALNDIQGQAQETARLQTGLGKANFEIAKATAAKNMMDAKSKALAKNQPKEFV